MKFQQIVITMFQTNYWHVLEDAFYIGTRVSPKGHFIFFSTTTTDFPILNHLFKLYLKELTFLIGEKWSNSDPFWLILKKTQPMDSSEGNFFGQEMACIAGSVPI